MPRPHVKSETETIIFKSEPEMPQYSHMARNSTQCKFQLHIPLYLIHMSHLSPSQKKILYPLIFQLNILYPENLTGPCILPDGRTQKLALYKTRQTLYCHTQHDFMPEPNHLWMLQYEHHMGFLRDLRRALLC